MSYFFHIFTKKNLLPTTHYPFRENTTFNSAFDANGQRQNHPRYILEKHKSRTRRTKKEMHHESYAEIWKVEKIRKMMEMSQVLVSLYILFSEWYQCQCRIKNKTTNTRKRQKRTDTQQNSTLWMLCISAKLITELFFWIFGFWKEVRTIAFACHCHYFPMKVGKNLWFPLTISICNILFDACVYECLRVNRFHAYSRKNFQ